MRDPLQHGVSECLYFVPISIPSLTKQSLKAYDDADGTLDKRPTAELNFIKSRK